MDKVDFVLVGSEAVVESGGLVNAVGSNQIAIIARAANKPFYALAERYFYIPDMISIQSLTPNSDYQLQVPPPVSVITIRSPKSQFENSFISPSSPGRPESSG
jgi:translation initiation factor eIF-2B subunit alpha